jgi:hypothetical protein
MSPVTAPIRLMRTLTPVELNMLRLQRPVVVLMVEVARPIAGEAVPLLRVCMVIKTARYRPTVLMKDTRQSLHP